jgi:endonuclease/exonuclease/phosphatase family metal-dependent hydrolase
MPHGAGKLALWLCTLLAGVCVTAARVEASTPCAAVRVTHHPADTDGERPARESLTIGSLNMAGQPRIADTLVKWVRDRAFDVVLLQEVGGSSLDGADFVVALGDRLGYHAAYAPADLFGDTETQGLAILSRDPLSNVRTYALEYHKLRFKSRCRIAMAATVMTGAGPIELVNVHLDTRINSKDRLAQIAPILDALDGLEGPQIFGGDFNTMNIRWFRTMWPFPFVEHQADAVRTRLGENGFQTFKGGRPTLKLLGLPIRLDWIYLKRLDAVDWSVDEVPLTDHRGVWTRVKLTSPDGVRDLERTAHVGR